MDAIDSFEPIPPTIPQKRNGLLRRLVRLVVIGIAAIVAAMAWVYFFECLPLGSGPAGPAVPREAFAKPWTTRKVLLLGLGDSVTAGFGVAPPLQLLPTPGRESRRRVRGHARQMPVGRAAEPANQESRRLRQHLADAPGDDPPIGREAGRPTSSGWS